MSKTWLHRISHHSEISYPLLEKGYLSIGWAYLSKQEYLDEVRSCPKMDAFDRLYGKIYGELVRSRFSLWRFIAQIKLGDRILVPGRGVFSVYEAIGEAVPVSSLAGRTDLQTWDGAMVHVAEDGLLYSKDNDKPYDLGFVIPVQVTEKNIPRAEYADAALIARMKVRPTNADIDDLSEQVNDAIARYKKNSPINLYANILEQANRPILEAIASTLDPNKLEELIGWYCGRVGASNVDIPAKNAKKDGDADVVATFEALRLIIYIQAKKHSGSTSDWAVGQVSDYARQFEDSMDGYSRISWVISTADSFRPEAVDKAASAGVTLINGEDFVKMLLDAGFYGLNI